MPGTETPRHLDRSKILWGVFLLASGVILMLLEKERGGPIYRTIWMFLIGAGIFTYLWGRFFSSPKD